jgi:methyl-CpG-binding domain protein 4
MLQFQLLIVCIFLNKTKGDRAIPQARRFLQKFPDPQSLAQAKYNETVPFFEKLGLLRRAGWVIELAKQWLTDPPVPNVVRKKLYGGKVTFESEVAHLKGVGTYASDAWRMFCKDDLYRSAEYIITAPEWTIVKPKDKELRAYLDWKHKVSTAQILDKEDQETDNLVANIEALSLGDAVKIQTDT